MTHIIDLQKLINESNISQSQKYFWENRIKNISDSEKKMYLALFQNYSDDILWVSEKLIEKEKAFNIKDMEKYDKIEKEIKEKLNIILEL